MLQVHRKTAKPRTVGGLTLDLKPMAIEVPKRTIKHEYEPLVLGALDQTLQRAAGYSVAALVE